MSRSRLFFTGIALFLIVGAGVAWVLSNQGILQNSWASPLGIAFSVLGVLFTFVQWTLPLTSSETKVSALSTESGYAQEFLYKQISDRLTGEDGALIIYEERQNIGKKIRIRSYSSHDEKEEKIVARIANGQPFFAAAAFRNLKPDTYIVYGTTGRNEDVTIKPGQIAELDWRRGPRKKQRILNALRLNSSLIAAGGALFLAHRYMTIPYLDSMGIVAAGLGIVNLLCVFLLSLFGYLERNEFDYGNARASLFVIELGAALFLAHRYLLVPYLDIVGFILMALGGLAFFLYLFEE